MNRMAMAARAVMLAAMALGVPALTACSGDDRAHDTGNVGTVTIPLSATVGTSSYRLDAVFTISGDSGSVTLRTQGDEATLSTTLPIGTYQISIDSFTLSKDDGTGTFHAVPASVVASNLPFTINADSTTTVAFHFLTDAGPVVPATGNVDITFDVTETGCNPIAVDAESRTVESARFFLDFSNQLAENPEELAVLRWNGGANLTQSWAIDACSSGAVSHFGNSLVPPDVQRGGQVVVGSGTTGSWEQDGASIVIHSLSSGCADSLSAPVETRYTFREGIGANTIEVERQFDFTHTAPRTAFRPFVPRLNVAFDRVIHPNAAGTALVSEDVFACPFGCIVSDWNGSWFAYVASSGPLAGQGMLVLREQTALPANLWIDNDAGSTSTNASSTHLFRPDGGFPALVTERELLCFFDASTFTAAQQGALTLPPGCSFDLACNAATSEPTVTQLAAGEAHTCALRSDGSVSCWGLLQLGAGDVPSVPFTEIAVGLYHGCGIRRADGGITCWGSNSQGQASPPVGSFQHIAANRFSTCAVATNGALSCWGLDGFGNAVVPPGGSYRYVGAGSAAGRMCAVRTDGTAVCFGSSTGDGSSPPPNAFQTVASALFESCGLATNGQISCWDRDFRQGNPPSGTFSALALGVISGCAIRTDGTLACWGEDEDGRASPP